MSENSQDSKPSPVRSVIVQPRLRPGDAELPPQAARRVTMLCDDPTDSDLIEVRWYIDAAILRH